MKQNTNFILDVKIDMDLDLIEKIEFIFKQGENRVNNDTLQFKVEITPTEEIESDVFWVYTINNVNSNHTIIATVNKSEILSIMQNGSLVEVKAVYKMINGVLVEQDDLSSLFDTSANYVKAN